MNYKICDKCKQKKPVNDYSFRSDTEKYNNTCKECKIKISQEWYKNNRERSLSRAKKYYEIDKNFYMRKVKEWQEKNKEKKLLYSTTWRWNERAKMIKAYGGKCVCCGETIPEFLTIDHINNDGNEERKTLPRSKRNGAGFYKWLREQNYPKDKYQLMC